VKQDIWEQATESGDEILYIKPSLLRDAVRHTYRRYEIINGRTLRIPSVLGGSSRLTDINSITNIQVDKSLVSRPLGYGTIVFYAGGTSNNDRLEWKNIPHAEEVRDYIWSLKSTNSSRKESGLDTQAGKVIYPYIIDQKFMDIVFPDTELNRLLFKGVSFETSIGHESSGFYHWQFSIGKSFKSGDTLAYFACPASYGGGQDNLAALVAPFDGKIAGVYDRDRELVQDEANRHLANDIRPRAGGAPQFRIEADSLISPSRVEQYYDTMLHDLYIKNHHPVIRRRRDIDVCPSFLRRLFGKDEVTRSTGWSEKYDLSLSEGRVSFHEGLKRTTASDNATENHPPKFEEGHTQALSEDQIDALRRFGLELPFIHDDLNAKRNHWKRTLTYDLFDQVDKDYNTLFSLAR